MIVQKSSTKPSVPKLKHVRIGYSKPRRLAHSDTYIKKNIKKIWPTLFPKPHWLNVADRLNRNPAEIRPSIFVIQMKRLLENFKPEHFLFTLKLRDMREHLLGTAPTETAQNRMICYLCGINNNLPLVFIKPVILKPKPFKGNVSIPTYYTRFKNAGRTYYLTGRKPVFDAHHVDPLDYPYFRHSFKFTVESKRCQYAK